MIVPRDCIAEAIHTALRKCCISPAANHLWFLLHVISEAARNQFYDIIYQEITHPDIKGDVQKMIKAVKLKFDDTFSRDRPLIVLLTACDLLEDDDWEGFFAFVDRG